MTVRTRTSTDQLAEMLALNPGLIGASTGFLTPLRGDWPAMVDAGTKISADVIELSALSGEELPGLDRYLRAPDLDGFRFVSIHGPAKGWPSSPHALANALERLLGSVNGIVMHPESLGDPVAFAGLGDRLWLENMDTRKDDGRTVGELCRFFDLLPDAQFCFDIAHAWLHDPAMRLAHALLDAFSDRLAEVHLSSILPSGLHIPLRSEAVAAFEPVLTRCAGVPWILEAPLPA
jgi:hypothetical protein